MTKSELLSALAEQTGLKKTEVTNVMQALVTTVYKTLKKEKKIKLEGLGILQLRDRKARLARNPRTGEMVKVPAKKVVKLRVTKDMKEAILGPAKK
ncbi:MAG TPA: HU family DNA-binding protein [bacterium]|nr:HU family DNA-binding protein [bacterium]